MYFDFATYFIAPVVGKRHFESNNWQLIFKEYCTISDEAFALLVFENNYNRWLNMALNNNWTESSVRPEYTTGGNTNQTPKLVKASKVNKKGNQSKSGLKPEEEEVHENNSSTSMYQGWSIQGIRRFNELYKLVKNERESDLGCQFELDYLQYCIDKKDQTKRKTSKKHMLYEACCHDLWVDEVAIEESNEFAEHTGDTMN